MPISFRINFLVKDPEPKMSGRGNPSIGLAVILVVVAKAVLDNELFAVAASSRETRMDPRQEQRRRHGCVRHVIVDCRHELANALAVGVPVVFIT
jgi:hypothetical protein